MFRAHVLIIRRSNLHYTASGIITPIGGRLVHRLSSQPPGRGPVPGPGINYTGPREFLLEFAILVFQSIFMNKCFIVEIF